jgi:hypothetical protein
LEPAPALARASTFADNAGTKKDVLALVDDVLAQIESRTGTLETEIAGTGWRIEVIRRGKYWQSRRGRGKERESRYGGKFSSLSASRQAEYYVNRERYHERRTGAAGADRNRGTGAAELQEGRRGD